MQPDVVPGSRLSVAAATVARDRQAAAVRAWGDGACPSREETFVIEGTLIAESLRTGTNLENMKLTVRKISRFQAQGAAGGQPGIWTTLRLSLALLTSPAGMWTSGLPPRHSWCSQAGPSATRGATRPAEPKPRFTDASSLSQKRSSTGPPEVGTDHSRKSSELPGDGRTWPLQKSRTLGVPTVKT